MGRVDELFPARTSSEQETRELGRALAARLRAGDVVALYGDLGAGKTALTRGICEGMGIAASEVASPTFTLLNEYGTGDLPVYHFDAYRIKRLEEFYDLGYEEYFFGDGVCVVEWAEKVEAIMPPDALRLQLTHGERDERSIDVARG